MPRSARDLVAEYQAIYAKADETGRDLTQTERDRVADLVEAARSQKSIEDGIREIGGAGDFSAFADPSRNSHTGGPGDAFIRSEGYKMIKAADMRPQQWSSGPVEVMGPPALMAKGTLLESGAGGPGGGLVPPLYQPGVVSKLFEPLGVADVFGQSQTTASQVRYVVEGTATNAAGGVAEGAAKPESTLAYSEIQEPVRKVATWLPASDEMLEDAPSIRGYLNERLSLFVRVEEERQLLRGAGTNELVGVFGRSGINQYTKLAADDNATGLAKVAANTYGSSFLYPTAIIMHPTNWLNTRLLRDGTGGTAGQFLGGGPFTGAYGQGNVASAGLFGGYLWNIPVVLSNYTGAGTALVGNFREGAHIWRRGGVSVEASNSHDQFFRLNLTALRAESRLALGLYRPVAVTEVRGLS
jgi:HK97 family phage major capsid protein